MPDDTVWILEMMLTHASGSDWWRATCAKRVLVHSSSCIAAVVTCGLSVCTRASTLLMCGNMWLRHETRSFHAGRSSQRFGSRSRHVVRMDESSGGEEVRCAFEISRSICADSCSS